METFFRWRSVKTRQQSVQMYFDKCRQSVNRIQNEEETFTRRTFMPSRVMRFTFSLFHNKIRIQLQYYVTRLSKLQTWRPRGCVWQQSYSGNAKWDKAVPVFNWVLLHDSEDLVIGYDKKKHNKEKRRMEHGRGNESRKRKGTRKGARCIFPLGYLYNIWLGKYKEKRRLGKPRRRWKNNVKMDLKGLGWESTHCIQLAQDRD